MKKLNLLLTIFLTTLFLFSCSDADDITVTLKQSGSLSVKIVDNNKKPVDNAKINIIYNFNPNSAQSILSYTTGNDGYWDAGSLLQNTYSYMVSAVYNNIRYNNSELFQIVSGEKKHLEINILDNVGKVQVYLYKNIYVPEKGWVEVPADKINVILVPYYKLRNTNYNDLKDYIENADFKLKTGADGYANFEGVPCNEEYHLAYYINENYSINGYYFTNKEKAVIIQREVSSYWE